MKLAWCAAPSSISTACSNPPPVPTKTATCHGSARFGKPQKMEPGAVANLVVRTPLSARLRGREATTSATCALTPRYVYRFFVAEPIIFPLQNHYIRWVFAVLRNRTLSHHKFPYPSHHYNHYKITCVKLLKINIAIAKQIICLDTYSRLRANQGNHQMLSKHARTVAMMNRDHSLAYLLRDYFGLRRGTALMPALLERGLGQADLVLALLRLRDAHRGPYGPYIELLVGHPIKVGPSCLQLYNAPPPPAQAATRDDRRIVHVHPTNPRQPGTGAYAEWSLYRVGRTLGQLYVRGVSRRDVRRVISNQWIRVEAA